MVLLRIDNPVQYNDIIANSTDLVVVYFFAVWCEGCKTVDQYLDQLVRQHSNVTFLKVDTDEHEDLAKDLVAVPGFYLFKNGAKLETLYGDHGDRIEQAIQHHK